MANFLTTIFTATKSYNVVTHIVVVGRASIYLSAFPIVKHFFPRYSITMEFEKSKIRSYGFTLRKTSLKNVTREAYEAHCNRLPWELYCDIVYEMEGGLHCHGVAYINSAIDKKRFNMRGWHVKLEELYDPIQWQIYCNKHQDAPTPDMIDSPPDQQEFEIRDLKKGSLFNCQLMADQAVNRLKNI